MSRQPRGVRKWGRFHSSLFCIIRRACSRYASAFVRPWSTALAYHSTAMVQFCSTPSPFWKQMPRLFIVHSSTVPLLGRLGVPLDGLGRVLLHAHAIMKADAEVVHGSTVPLLGRLGVPLHGLGQVLLHALALLEAAAEVAHGRTVPLLGRLGEPLDGLGQVLLHALALVEAVAEVVHGSTVPTVCTPSRPPWCTTPRPWSSSAPRPRHSGCSGRE
jgi:hypothetical protein